MASSNSVKERLLLPLGENTNPLVNRRTFGVAGDPGMRVTYCFIVNFKAESSGTVIAPSYAVEKNNIIKKSSFFIFFVALLMTFFVCSPAFARVEAHFLYNLSDFSGTLPLSGGKLAVDYERDET